MDQLPRVENLSVLAVEPLAIDNYQFLVERPETGRQQPYVRGRNLTVGQLIYTMRANNLTPQQAAEDFSLPLEQVLEAQAYFRAHGNLIASETLQESLWLQRLGVELDSGP